MLASATPVMRLVAPGPSVDMHTPARPVRRPYTSAMNAAPCSWCVVTNLIGTVQQRIHHVDVLFAGNAEDVLDTFVLEALDEQFSGFHSGSSRVFAAVISRS